jgi:hypothetical protein
MNSKLGFIFFFFGSFRIHYSPVIVPFDAVELSIRITSLNKLRVNHEAKPKLTVSQRTTHSTYETQNVNLTTSPAEIIFLCDLYVTK